MAIFNSRIFKVLLTLAVMASIYYLAASSASKMLNLHFQEHPVFFILALPYLIILAFFAPLQSTLSIGELAIAFVVLGIVLFMMYYLIVSMMLIFIRLLIGK